MAELWLVVGLGNPGRKYQGNRHNVGFMVADALAAAGSDLDWKSSSRFQAELAKGTLDGRAVVLVKPQTYMNASGRAVVAVAGFYGVELERIVAIHDDVDLELGRLRLKSGGGDGGHKGIASMAQDLGGAGFARVRFGVGRPAVGEVADFVLQDFRSEERELVGEQVGRAAEAVRVLLGEGLRVAMNRFNAAPRSKQDEDDEGEKSGSGAAQAGRSRGGAATDEKNGSQEQ